MDNSFDRFMFLLIGLPILFIVLLIGLAPFIMWQSIGAGEHTGVVTSVDQVGYIWKNYTVYFKTDNQSSQEDTYCVHRNNPEFANLLKEMARTGERITISYQGVRGFGKGLCHTTEIKGVSHE